jgi:hypothetical protein
MSLRSNSRRASSRAASLLSGDPAGCPAPFIAGRPAVRRGPAAT